MDGDGGSSSGAVSSTSANERQVARADPELPQPNAPPPTTTGPTENEAAFLRQFARAYGGRLVLSRMPLGGANTGHSAIFFESTRDGGDGEDHHPLHGDTAADVGADADDTDDDDDDAYGGFGFVLGAVPASGVAIACLPETTVGEARDLGGECAVCLEEYEAGDALRTMPCAHGFHERCIVEWLRASRLCPLCRFAMPAEEDTDSDVELGRDGRGEETDDDDDSDGPLYITFERMFET